MKTLPEILKTQMSVDKYGTNLVNKLPIWAVEAATKAIAKELMGIIGEDEVRPPSGPKRNGIEQGLRRTRNRLRAEQRARLTAFIGEVEK